MSVRGRKRLPRPGSYGRFLHDRKKYGPIADFVAKQIATDPLRYGAKTRAQDAAACRFRVDSATVQRAVAKIRPWDQVAKNAAKILAGVAPEMERQLALITQQFSEPELAQFGDPGLPFLYQLARERAELKALRASKSRK